MNRRRKFLLASVLALQNSSFIYPSCEKCFSRVILISTRSNCPKCGSTGEAENVSYRYRLSLKVAESNRLFGITVFGSCLDTFFGLTATRLYRYLQHPNEIPGTLDSNTTQNLLTKAVETCFVGRCFIFGVTNFENHHGRGSDSSHFLKQCLDRKREVKALVACQILLPYAGVAGFTVIDYFHQLLYLSGFRKLHCGSQTTNSHILALEQSNSDLSSIYGSDKISSFESHVRDDVSRLWQSSFELTSIISQLTDSDDFSASEPSKATTTHHQDAQCISFVKATGSSSCCDTIQGSWSIVSYEDKKTAAQKSGKELGLQTNQSSIVHNSHHEIGITDCDLFPLKTQEPIEPKNKKLFDSTVESRYSQRDLTCYQHHDVDTTPHLQEISACFPSLSLRIKELPTASEDGDLEIWDDLPFSESLNKFLAVIENEIALSQTEASSKNSDLGNDISEVREDHSRLSVTPQRTTEAFHMPPIALRSSQANSSKDNYLWNCEADPCSRVQKASQPGNTEAVTISKNGIDTSLPHLSAVFPPSSKYLETAVTFQKSARIPSLTAEISHTHHTSQSDHSCLNIKYVHDREENSLSEINEKLTIWHSKGYKDVSDLCNLENKQYRWAKNQGDSFAICRKLTYPSDTLFSSPDRSTDTLKEMPYEHINGNVTQNCSSNDEGSYNASADLFDDSAKEVDIETEMSKKSRGNLVQWGKSLTKSHHRKYNFSLRSLSENSIQSSQKLSLQSTSASLYPKTCFSSPHFQSDSEYDFEDSQDFIPCSQSTPVAGFHQTRIHGMNRPFKKLPAFKSYLDVNYNKTRTFSENNKQQATSSCHENIKTPRQKSRSPVLSNIIQPVDFNNCLTPECLETDADEWVPPSTEKRFLSEILELQARGLRKCLAACNSPVSKQLPRKKLKYIKQRTKKCLIKELSTNSDWISKGSVLGLGSCSAVKCCLPYSENWPFSVSENKGAWSPELFSQKIG
ncbi:DNA damage-induced apoptosis suppressor protein [Talpa occidentalis]|uniref:DNA damage-induced apoptosis suppressor protein n=1 Tax=Talpa occidentalis TaxID=50954 RepID=UPI00188F2A4F|nr:DNA damage-induced apoptosis suppressor protein [Talpa occidentalis]XP_037378944.1 DNA damage-induced apoptosis suppressor protein [Talpa occidentalis]XP_054555541.1 DNA damage-induced apoptosis suppressor protein [Talpa occidentalis]